MLENPASAFIPLQRLFPVIQPPDNLQQLLVIGNTLFSVSHDTHLVDHKRDPTASVAEGTDFPLLIGYQGKSRVVFLNETTVFIQCVEADSNDLSVQFPERVQVTLER